MAGWGVVLVVSSLAAAASLVPHRAMFGFPRKQKYSFPAGYLFVLEQTVKATWLWGVKGKQLINSFREGGRICSIPE